MPTGLAGRAASYERDENDAALCIPGVQTLRYSKRPTCVTPARPWSAPPPASARSRSSYTEAVGRLAVQQGLEMGASSSQRPWLTRALSASRARSSRSLAQLPATRQSKRAAV